MKKKQLLSSSNQNNISFAQFTKTTTPYIHVCQRENSQTVVPIAESQKPGRYIFSTKQKSEFPKFIFADIPKIPGKPSSTPILQKNSL